MEIRILGPLEVLRDGTTVGLGGPRQRALFALLVMRGGAVVPRDRLIDELWGADPPESAVNVIQTYLSHLRKLLPEDRILSRPPGYALRIEPDELDLHRFERLVQEGRRSLAEGDSEGASLTLREALALWRGPALADVVQAELARVEAARLEELRLGALEERIEADLALGRHGELVSDLEALVAEHPLRERLRAQLMLALYRSSRQSEALAVYRDARSTLVDELGIEPGSTLREMEAAILRHDPSLDAPSMVSGAAAQSRSLVVVAFAADQLGALVELAEPLARRPRHELVVVCLVDDAASLAHAAQSANERRAALADRGLAARAVAFTSKDPAEDVIRLARSPDVSLLLLHVPDGLLDDGTLRLWLSRVLADAPCDVAVLANENGTPALDPGAPVAVPFGGAEHEWAAAEVGAWIAAAEGRPLELIGAAADAGDERRDASRLLASVALLVQQVAAIETTPSLVATGPSAVADAVEGCRAVVLGLPDDWATRGLGATRSDLVRRAKPPVLLVRGGLRPGGLAPAETLTRYTWTLTHHGA
ncbi:MAG TPA: AfsR/SARP family transcriptional regulator [Gaiellaceae bacterium]|nr:AfsR/SARP family transcriptional regulator [Gaiellaceae bacterium]